MHESKMKDICSCDVKDKKLLACFREKLEHWKVCFSGSDPHSIDNQLTKLFWDNAVYRTFNEARRLSEETNDPSTGLQGTIIDLLDRNFMKSQAIAIRCLTDRDSKVYSLRRLFDQIKNNISLYTRENYVCYDGMSYDESPDDDHRVKYKRNERQAKYDLLSGRDKNSRDRNETISSTVFAKIEDEVKKDFKTMRGIEIFVNNWVAHTAAPWNQEKHAHVLDKTSLKKLDDCYQALICIGKKVELFIDKFLLCSVPTPQFDKLENWDKPVVIPKDLKALEIYWLERVREIENWAERATIIHS